MYHQLLAYKSVSGKWDINFSYPSCNSATGCYCFIYLLCVACALRCMLPSFLFPLLSYGSYDWRSVRPNFFPGGSFTFLPLISSRKNTAHWCSLLAGKCLNSIHSTGDFSQSEVYRIFKQLSVFDVSRP